MLWILHIINSLILLLTLIKDLFYHDFYLFFLASDEKISMTSTVIVFVFVLHANDITSKSSFLNINKTCHLL